MLKYLIIVLDKTSTSFCHYSNPNTERELMPLDTLKSGILFGMKENLNIQFVYPDYDLPQEYKYTIHSIDHTDIRPVTLADDAKVIVINSWAELDSLELKKDVAYVLRTSKVELFDKYALLGETINQTSRLNVVITDLETFTDADFETYKRILAELAQAVKKLYANSKSPQLNLLTDRMMLTEMNNCNAGSESITLAPDGKFYVCPAFYLEGTYSIGDLNSLDIKNPQLYRLDHAPICRSCDAFHCKRCIWLNRKTTLEVNTPSHQQCVVSHLERNASRQLLSEIRQLGMFLPDKPEIPYIDYLDPFENVSR